MRKKFLILLISVSFVACQSDILQIVEVTNTEEHDRVNELIELKTTDLSLGQTPFKILHQQNEIPYQLIDKDGDGNWDHLLTLIDIKGLTTDSLIFQKTDHSPQYSNATQVRHKKLIDHSFGEEVKRDTMILGLEATDFTKVKLPPYLTEGPAWENDKVGFRLYFDKRNGRDIWGKLTSSLVLDQVGTDTTISYHELQPWGMDILKVGGSLGAGAVAFIYNDSIYRLAGDQFESIVYEELYDGPIQSAFRMVYKGYKMHPSIPAFDLEEKISITKGQWYYQNQIKVVNAPEDLELATGIVNLHNIAFKYLEVENQIGMYSYGLQSENKDELGMAIIVNRDEFKDFLSAPSSGNGVVNTHIIKMKIQPNGNEYKFLAMWSKSMEGLNEIQFVDELNTLLYNLGKKIVITIK